MLSGLPHQRQRIAAELQRGGDRLVAVQVVVDIAGQDRLVSLNEEARSIADGPASSSRDDRRLTLADLRALAHRPGFDFPGGQVLGHGERDRRLAVLVGDEGARPEGGVGKVLADDRDGSDGRGGRFAGFGVSFVKGRRPAVFATIGRPA